MCNHDILDKKTYMTDVVGLTDVDLTDIDLTDVNLHRYKEQYHTWSQDVRTILAISDITFPGLYI